MSRLRLLHGGVIALLLIGLVAAVGPSGSRAAGEITPVTLSKNGTTLPPGGSLPLYEMLEMTFSLPTPYDPLTLTSGQQFDPDVVNVRAQINTPDGRTDSVAGFWYEPVTVLTSGNDRYQANSSAGVWKVRYAPRALGAYQYQIIASGPSGTISSDAGSFTATAALAGNHGFLYTDPLRPNRFLFDDGTPHLPVGANLAWNEIEADFSSDFAFYKAAKLNFARVWLTYSSGGPNTQTEKGGHFTLEWTGSNRVRGTDTMTWGGLGKYNQENAYKVDKLLEQARANDLHLMLSLMTPQAFGDWYTASPYFALISSEYGGNPFGVNKTHFWDNPTVVRYFKNYVRYIGARYGAYTNLGVIEFWNEADGLKPVDYPSTPTSLNILRTWNQQMVDALYTANSRQTLTTTSFASFGKSFKDCPPLENGSFPAYPTDPTCTGLVSYGNLPMLPLAQGHWFEKKTDVVSGWGDVIRWGVEKYARPYFIGEYGWDDGRNNNYSGPLAPKLDRMNHHSTWVPIFHGGAAASNLLWRINFSFVPPANFQANYQRFAAWIASETPYLRQYDHSWGGDSLTGFWAGGFKKSNRAAFYFYSKAANWDVEDAALTQVTGATYTLSGMAAGTYTVAWTNPYTGQLVDPITGLPVVSPSSIVHPGGNLVLSLPPFLRDLAVKVYDPAETPPPPLPILATPTPTVTLTPTATATATATPSPTGTLPPTATATMTPSQPTATLAPGQPTHTPTQVLAPTPTPIPGGGGGGQLPNVNWYFAEGFTGPGFDEYLTINNPGPAGQATITYYVETPAGSARAQAEVISKPVNLAANSRTTIVVHDANMPGGLGRRNTGHATQIVSTVPVVAERPIYFRYSPTINGGHNVLGATTQAKTWYFAEGFTGDGFDEFLTILNTGAAGQATITYFVEGETVPTVKTVALPASSRTTIAVHDANVPGGLGRGKAHATKVETTVDTVVERPMYFRYSDVVDGGHIVAGATTLGQTWYFAEGYTGTGFDEYLTINNPGTVAGSAKITYYIENGATEVHTVALKAASRTTVTVHQAGGGGLGRLLVGHATKVETTVDTVVERPSYFTYGPGYDGGHNVLGATEAATDWYFAEGYTGTGFDEYLTINNPGNVAGQAIITYFVEGQTTVSQRVVQLKANSRTTVIVHGAYNPAGNPGGLNRQSSGHATKLISTVPVVVERPMYFTYSGATIGVVDGGHNVMGYAP